MRILIIIIGSLIPLPIVAASIFDTFWKEAASQTNVFTPSEHVIDFVIRSAETWNDHGIVLERSDIEAALAGGTTSLCEGKTTTSGDEINFAGGSAIDDASCSALQRDIVELVEAETTAEQLADDLLSLAVGAELVLADEPRDPIDIPTAVRGIKRLWQATGATVLPWDSAADDALNELRAALNAVPEEELPAVILKLQHGNMRAIRENDPRFFGIGDSVMTALSGIASALDIQPDAQPRKRLSPPLGIERVGLWVRTDDLGLLWNTPSREHVLQRTLPEEYPTYHTFGDQLAYPFAYDGPWTPESWVRSPLCSRPMARAGYLCRKVPDSNATCRPTNPDSLSLVECEAPDPHSQPVRQTTSACLEYISLYRDDGTPLFDEEGDIHDDLLEVEPGNVCQPDTTVQYPAGILQNLCYVDACVRESLDGHSLFPSRNPVLAYQSTSPFLACVRPDPQLGFYTEITAATPSPLPPYLGAELVTEFTTSICQITGGPPHPLSGYCLYQENLRSQVPATGQLAQFVRTALEQEDVDRLQVEMQSLAASVGTRLAVDQSVLVHTNALQPLVHFLQELASLFQELTRAPLPTAACPWTGPPTRTP